MIFPRELFHPQKVVFYPGAVEQLAGEALEFGERGLIVHGQSFIRSSYGKVIQQQFPDSSYIDFFCRKSGEPVLDEIVEVLQIARARKVDWIAGIGGGSVIDLAKAAAGLINAKESPVFYQEGGKLEKAGLPFIAIPTTAGTGSEATPNSVIINPAKKAKLSIRDRSFLARKVILDSRCLDNLPSSVMAYSGLDALVQGYEAFISKNASWYSDVFASKSIELMYHHLVPAIEKRTEEHMEAILLGSYFAGVALATARLGVIHGVAHPLGVLYGVPHGLVCSVCFLPSIQLNREAMQEKYAIMSRIFGEDFEESIRKLLTKLKIVSPLKNKEIVEKEAIISETMKSGSTAANPKPITREDVEFLLKEIF